MLVCGLVCVLCVRVGDYVVAMRAIWQYDDTLSYTRTWPPMSSSRLQCCCASCSSPVSLQ